MNLREFELEGKAEYLAYSEIVKNLLVAALRDLPLISLQHAQFRAKEIKSLRLKLKKQKKLRSNQIEEYIKDLAGCRLVFYTNSDVSMFHGSRVLIENFEIDWDRTKIHYPDQDIADPRLLFISDNYVVKLSEARLQLPEYARFKDMSCEVQIQTTLNHAWAETAHDTIYKNSFPTGFGSDGIRTIESRMKRVMREYLLPAGFQIQKIRHDFHKLLKGSLLFGADIVSSINSSHDNADLIDVFNAVADSVLVNVDDLRQIHEATRAAVVNTARDAQERDKELSNVLPARARGSSTDDVVSAALTVLRRIQFVTAEAVLETYEALVELAAGASDQQFVVLKRFASELARNKIDIWNSSGPIVQTLLASHLEKKDSLSLVANWDLNIEILKEVLQTRITGTTSTAQTVTMHTGAITPNPAWIALRKDAYLTLTRMFEVADDVFKQRQLIGVLFEGATPPHQGNYSDELTEELAEYESTLATFFLSGVEQLSFEVVQVLESRLLSSLRKAEFVSKTLPSN